MNLADPCIDILRTLIAHQTVNPGGDELGLCKHLRQELIKRGANKVEIHQVHREGTPAAYVYATFGQPTLLLNSHIDTVPVNQGWVRDPFSLAIEGNNIYGLGACDIKGAVAAILTALDQEKGHNIGVLFSGDEENGSHCLPHFLSNTDTSSIRHAIVCEPTARKAGVQHRGIISFHAIFQGSGGHSSRADFMPKPIVELAKMALGLDQLAKNWLQTGPAGMQGLCMNVAKLSGGVAYNVVPNSAKLTFSLRPPPGFARKKFDQELEQLRVSCEDSIKILNPLDQPPFSCGAQSEIKSLLQGHSDSFVGLDFWTEAALLQESGIHSVVIGPGDISQAHAPDEYVTKDDLIWATNMFKKIIGSHAT